MEKWQFNVLFCVGVGGAVLLLFAPALGLESIPNNPMATAGIGSILAYVLTQKRSIVRDHKKDEEPPEKEEPPQKEEEASTP